MSADDLINNEFQTRNYDVSQARDYNVSQKRENDVFC